MIRPFRTVVPSASQEWTEAIEAAAKGRLVVGICKSRRVERTADIAIPILPWWPVPSTQTP